MLLKSLLLMLMPLSVMQANLNSNEESSPLLKVTYLDGSGFTDIKEQIYVGPDFIGTIEIKKCPISRANIFHFETLTLYQNVSTNMVGVRRLELLRR